jgi:rhodanese-related sulfurtransferase
VLPPGLSKVQYLIILSCSLADTVVTFVTENIFLFAIAFVSGAMLLWPIISRRGANGLDTLAATRMINDTDALILDVRAPGEFEAGHLPGARNIPLADLPKRAGELPAGRPVIVCCNTGATSVRGVGELRKSGRDQVFNLDGGLNAWRQAGLPVVR